MKKDIHFTAKTDIKQPGHYLSLRDHHLDVAFVAGKLMEILPDNVVRETGLTRELLEKVVILVSCIHDIGKITGLFLGEITKTSIELRLEIEEGGLFTTERSKLLQKEFALHHTEMGYIILLKLTNQKMPESICNVVYSHHGNCPPIDYNRYTDILTDLDKECLYGTMYEDDTNISRYREKWEECISEALEASGFDSTDEIPDLNFKAQIIVASIIIFADWIASNTYCFPLVENLTMVNRIERESCAEKKLKLPSRWNPTQWSMNREDFKSRFGFYPNEFQQKAIDVVNRKAIPGGLTIAEEAPGRGKTPAVMAISEIEATRTSAGGMCIMEPTKATGTAMFDRIVEWARAGEWGTGSHNVNLAHSAADTTQNFISVLAGEKSGVYASSLFTRSKMSCFPTFVSGTWDPVLTGALRLKHFMMRLFSVIGKVCCFDEIHEADAYTEESFRFILHVLGLFNVPTCIATATLSSKRKAEYIDAYLKGAGLGRKERRDIRKQILDSDIYPSITCANIDGVKCFACGDEKWRKTYKVSYCNENDIEKLLNLKLKGTGCAGVVVNTVKHAQEVYDRLCQSPLLKDYNIVLDHSKFLSNDRNDAENKILLRLGKNSDKSLRRKTIVIGTKVIQLSLDYDVDFLITEPCSISDLFQRMGRLFRHERTGRPVSEPEVAIMRPGNGNEKPYSKGTEYIYGEYILKKTLEVLSETVTFPDDIKKLVNMVEETGNTGLFKTVSEEDEAEYLNRLNEKADRAKACLLNVDRFTDDDEDGLAGLLDNMTKAESRYTDGTVRDIKPGLRVVLLGTNDKGEVVFLDRKNRGRVISPENLSFDDVMDIEHSDITLPQAVLSDVENESAIAVTASMINRRAESIAPGLLGQNGMAGKCVLILDRNNEASINGYRLCYSNERGLSYEKI